jgi:hypothetical protein
MTRGRADAYARRRLGGVRSRVWSLAGAVLALALSSGAWAGAGAKDKGAVMATSDGVSMRRLGDRSPHLTYHGTSGRDFVDPSPLVLWAGDRPAAALYFEVETRGRKAVQRIAPMDGSVKLPGFPVTHEIHLPHDARSEDEADAIDAGALTPADVDGDGVQELLVMRQWGGVSVHGVRGQHHEYPSPASGPGGAHHKLYLAHLLDLGGRDVVYVLSVSEAAGADRNLLLRVDGKGITRVRLEGLDEAKILALGAIQRPGSQDLDELLALVADGERDAVLGRFRPDGKRIDAPRRMYVRPSPSGAFHFVPRSSKAVLEVAGGVLVISPEKQANWIRELKVHGMIDPADVRYQFVADLETPDPKVVYAADGALWAVSREDKCFGPAAPGRWSPLPKPGPYLRVPVPEGEKLWFVWENGGERLFAVASGERGTRPLTHDEWAQAADRYLPPDEAAAFRKRRQPSLEGEHGYRDIRMKREREERHVGEVRSVEEWKRLLPRSYAEVLKYDATSHDVEVESRLEQLREDPRLAAKAPDFAGLRAFLGGIQVPARTTFMAIDGRAVRSVTVPGSPMRMLETQVRRPVDHQLSAGRIRACIALEKGDPDGKAPPAFYEIEAPLAETR